MSPAARDDDPARWPVGRLLSAAARRVEREWNAHLAAWDLNHASLPVLFLLLEGARTQRELAVAVDVSEQTMSRTVATLARAGYVTRTPDAADRRRLEVAVTASGRSAVLAAGAPGPAEEIVVRGLSPAEADELRRLLAVVARAGTRPDGADGT
ncbi:MarR family winged helix-turn-helix transcriptional regulator [Cellulomonas alba]|uniref:MarR family transcriptional regulator n=1 Tax=Cellulomonas alba TaxID=3053467 RepID=A0ABT7SFK5_9CELL|nr:MarR family transcriptional regulator [Cellulomonas alba]MDM7854980.1 MarR family transcriptional regulator [Cellulomonas alba]